MHIRLLIKVMFTLAFLSALIEQAERVTLTSRAFRNDQLPLLYKELSELSGYDMSLPMNSGAEAVETALKLARKWAYQVKKFRVTKPKLLLLRATSMVARFQLLRFQQNHSIVMILAPSRQALL